MKYTLDIIKKQIIKLINKAEGKAQAETDDLVFPPNQEMGDLSLPCFNLAKKLKKSPNELAESLLKKIQTDEIISGIKTAGPYLNFTINKNYLSERIIKEVAKKEENYGDNKKLKGQKIMVEFAHPNPFKSFHIGHLRNIILGESLVRIIESQGAKLIRVNYQGDVGMHIAKCLWAFQEVNPQDYPKSADEKVALLGKCYAKGAKAFDEDDVSKRMITAINKLIYTGTDKEIKSLWNLGKKWSLEKFHEIYDRVYTYFDREYMESEVMDDGVKYVKQALDKGILKKSDGAVIFDGQPYGIDTRVFLNSEGLPTYEGKELGLAFREFKDFGKIDLCIHNVAVEQISFFKTTFKVEELLDKGLFKGKQYHNAYEFVGLKKGKMSSRKGDVILGNDILNEANKKVREIIKEKRVVKDINNISEVVGTGAVKYAFLNINPFKYLAFDIDECVSFEGNSGPYLQYTYARIKSIARRAKVKKINTKINYEALKEIKESNLILKIAKYPAIVEVAAQNYDPSELAKYLFELAKEFNDYYHSEPILKSETKVMEARLSLSLATAQVIKNGLNLLGIKTLEKM